MEVNKENLINFKNKSGIYILSINNKKYIGSSIDLNDRILTHLSLLKRNKHHSNYLQNLYNKYNTLDFDILEIVEETNNLLEREKYYINILNPKCNSVLDPTIEFNCKVSSKIVYQYDLKGNYINSYPSVKEAGRQLKVDSRGIGLCAAGDKTYYKSAYGFIWSYKKSKKLKAYSNNSKISKIVSVFMYDIEGNYIMKFKSIAEAARYVGLGRNKNFDSLCAVISCSCKREGKCLVHNKYRFIKKYKKKIKLRE